MEEIDGMCVRHKNRKAVLTLISNASETGQLQLTVTRNEEKNSGKKTRGILSYCLTVDTYTYVPGCTWCLDVSDALRVSN